MKKYILLFLLLMSSETLVIAANFGRKEQYKKQI